MGQINLHHLKTIKSVADILSISEGAVRTKIKNGELTKVNYSNRSFIYDPDGKVWTTELVGIIETDVLLNPHQEAIKQRIPKDEFWRYYDMVRIDGVEMAKKAQASIPDKEEESTGEWDTPNLLKK